MMTRFLRLATAGAALVFAAALAAPAYAVRVGVLSNQYSIGTTADFTANIAGHTFTAVDVSSSVPTLAALTANFDVLLLFEDGTFANAPAVGDVVAAFAATGRPVVLGTFYDQDRSDAANPALLPPHGWGALETIDPNTTDGIGVATDGSGLPNMPHTLDGASVVAHPLTAGVTSLFAATGFAGGNQAKPGTTVLATWTQLNARGLPDPAIAFRVTGVACVIHIGIAPDYATYGTYGTVYGGDFYRAWQNAFDFAATACGIGASAVPTLQPLVLMLMALLLAALGAARLRRPRHG